jgi:hypothetical protein
MRKIALALAVAVSLAGLSGCTATLNGALSSADAKVRPYCVYLVTAAEIATEMKKQALLDKIAATTNIYCDPSNPINDLPGALVALAKVIQAVDNAGIKAEISMAAN